MTEATVLEVLRGTRFLAGLPEADVGRLAAAARFEDYPPGAMLFREWEKLDRVFLVAAGTVALEVHVPGQGAKPVYTVGPGELLGWSPILNREAMTASARAQTAARVIALDAARVLAHFREDPAFGMTFMRRMAEALAERLTATRLQMLGVYRRDQPAGGVAEGAD